MKNKIALLFFALSSIVATPVFAIHGFDPHNQDHKRFLSYNKEKKIETEKTETKTEWKSWVTKKTVAVGVVAVVVIAGIVMYSMGNNSDDLFANIDVNGMYENYASYWNKSKAEAILKQKPLRKK